jgi:hypothetical protein
MAQIFGDNFVCIVRRGASRDPLETVSDILTSASKARSPRIRTHTHTTSEWDRNLVVSSIAVVCFSLPKRWTIIVFNFFHPILKGVYKYSLMTLGMILQIARFSLREFPVSLLTFVLTKSSDTLTLSPTDARCQQWHTRTAVLTSGSLLHVRLR